MKNVWFSFSRYVLHCAALFSSSISVKNELNRALRIPLIVPTIKSQIYIKSNSPSLAVDPRLVDCSTILNSTSMQLKQVQSDLYLKI